MKLLLMIPSLGPGGAERVMSLLAGALAARGHDVCLLTLCDARADFFAVDSRVRRVALNVAGDSRSVYEALRSNAGRVRAIRRAVIEAAPDAVLSFMTTMNVLAILACVGLRTRVVVSERIDPQSHAGEKLWTLLRSIVYPRADALVVQTKQAAAWFRERLRRTPVAVIPNPVTAAVETADPSLRMQGRFILAAGRLVPQKGFDILIRSFAAIAPEQADVRLVIAGQGPEAEPLRQLAAQLGVQTRVHFAGAVRTLSALMQSATVFVLSSRYEGFPNVLLEALANSVAVISTDCPGGPREVLADGKYGVLVACDDEAGLAAALNRLLNDGALRSRLAEAGSEAIRNYRLESVTAEWERLLLRP
ncbi:MAG TPA: glycosyltransferase family 4 protein [Steroidobacter sp.]|uniref:glycosyltransferase family 4 protein n=1 Tax=Steroidobacter sp. TaxID=1978227 RepID=UPI002ED81D7F